jgi:toxin ParE1/3/4
MARFELSEKADQDLTGIYHYSYQHFGADKAAQYLDDLDTCFNDLAASPRLGHSISAIRPGYFRFEHASHTIFYTLKGHGIFIVRVLHKRMDCERHLPE